MFLRTALLGLALWSASVLGAPSAPVVVLAVDGMTCPLCVAAVNKALRTTPGVISAKTHLADEQAEVEIAPELEVDALLDAVKAAGYDARVIRKEPVED